MKLVGLIILILSLYSCVFAQEAQKIDDFENLICDDYLTRMHRVIDEIDDVSNSKIYFLVYEGKEFGFYPRQGLAKAKIESIKELITKVRQMTLDKFIFVNAGFRENAKTEIWLVPTGATPPKPTPTVKKMKYRKGRAKGYCVVCCGEN